MVVLLLVSLERPQKRGLLLSEKQGQTHILLSRAKGKHRHGCFTPSALQAIPPEQYAADEDRGGFREAGFRRWEQGMWVWFGVGSFGCFTSKGNVWRHFMDSFFERDLRVGTRWCHLDLHSTHATRFCCRLAT